MNLIRILNEASSLSLPDLKKAIKKDKSVSMVLDASSSLADVPDKDAFVKTLKYLIMNNDGVQGFVSSRDNVRDLSKASFDYLRKLRTDELTAVTYTQIKEFISNLFKEHSHVARKAMSPALSKELKSWFNKSGRYFNLPLWAINELKANPNFRQNKKIVVYRGVLFTENDLKKSVSYNGDERIGNGIKFVKAIRKLKDNKAAVDLDWSRPSSWTLDKSVAERFARFAPSSNNTMAMLSSLSRGNKAIDGELGYIISALVDAEDVLLDTTMLDRELSSFSDEKEVILAPGKITAKLVKKFTPDGESKELHSTLDATSIHTAVAILKQEIPALKDGADLIKSTGVESISDSNFPYYFKRPNVVQKLLLDSTTTMAFHGIDVVHSLIKKAGLDKLSPDQLTPDNYTEDNDIDNANVIKSILAELTRDITHSKFENGKGKKFELTAEEYRTTLKNSDIAYLEKDLVVNGKISNSKYYFRHLFGALDVEIPSSFLAMGAAKQKPFIDLFYDKFFDRLNISKPSSDAECAKKVINLLKRGHRNLSMLNRAKWIYDQLNKLK